MLAYPVHFMGHSGRIHLIAALICFFVSLFDAYIINVGRYLDYLALLVCMLAVYFDNGWRHFFRLSPFVILLALYFTILSLAFGAQLRHLAGLLFMLCCFHVFRLFIDRRPAQVDAGIIAVAVLFLGLFGVQLLFGRVTGFFIDFNAPFSDIPSRIHTHEAYNFRPASVFQEPNSFSVFAYMTAVYLLVSLKSGQIFRQIVIASLVIAMFASNSLWGMSASFLVLLFALCHRHIKLVLVCASIIALTSPVLVVDNTVQRLIDLPSDGSFKERYIAAKPQIIPETRDQQSAQFQQREIEAEAEEQPKGFFKAQVTPQRGRINGASFPSIATCPDRTAIQRYFGSGLYPNCFQARNGANGFSYVYDVFGLLGILLSIGTLLYYDRSKFRLSSVAVVFLFSTFPIVTYAFFAFMVTLIFRADETLEMKSA